MKVNDDEKTLRDASSLPAGIWVANAHEAFAWISQWESPSWLAIDTEFNRETTFFPQLGVVQAYADTWSQPLVLDGHQEPCSLLVDIVGDPQVTKYVFAGSEDYLILDRWLGRQIRSIVDLQWGIALAGGPSQSSLQKAVAERLGIHLPKEVTRSDWSKRPLSQEHINYAANDVFVLGALADTLRSSLEQLGRWEWLQEDTQWQLNDALRPADEEHAWKRVKGLARLSNLHRHRGSALARWREQQALRQDRPRGFFMKDEVLLKLAQVTPSSVSDLAKVKGVHHGALRRYGGEWMDCLRSPEEQIERPDSPQPWSDYHKRLLNALRARTRDIAQVLDISPEVLASRRHLVLIVRWFRGEMERQPRVMSGWRGDVAAEAWVEACQQVDVGDVR